MSPCPSCGWHLRFDGAGWRCDRCDLELLNDPRSVSDKDREPDTWTCPRDQAAVPLAWSKCQLCGYPRSVSDKDHGCRVTEGCTLMGPHMGPCRSMSDKDPSCGREDCVFPDCMNPTCVRSVSDKDRGEPDGCAHCKGYVYACIHCGRSSVSDGREARSVSDKDREERNV